MSKFTFNENPPLPAKCISCFNDFKPGRPAIDWGMSLDFYGAVLFCSDCILNAATSLLDLCPVAERDSAVAEVEALQAELIETKDKVEAYANLFDAYRLRHPGVSDHDSDDTSDTESDAGAGEKSGGTSKEGTGTSGIRKAAKS